MNLQMKQHRLRFLPALVLALALCAGMASPAMAEESALPDWAGDVAVAGVSLSSVSDWTENDGIWTCNDWSVPGVASVMVYDSRMLSVVVDGDVALSGDSLVDTANVDDLRLTVNVAFSDGKNDITISRADNGPAFAVDSTDSADIDCTMILESGSTNGGTCHIDRMEVASGATFQLVYQERATNKSSTLAIDESLTIADGASFKAWAIGNSYLTVAVEEGANVDNLGNMSISGTEFDNAGSIANNGDIDIEVAGFNNNGSVDNNGTLRLSIAQFNNHDRFTNHANVSIGATSSFENNGGTITNGADASEADNASISVSDGGHFVNDASSTLDNNAPVNLEGRGDFANSDFKDTHCTYHCFSDGASATYTEPATCYVCGQNVYEADTIAPEGTLSINGVAFSDLSAIAETMAVNPGAPVTLNASDGQSGLKHLFYYVSDRALDADEVAAIEDWQGISFDSATDASVSIGPDPVGDLAGVDRFAVYIKMEDDAGHDVEGASDNITYLGSALVEIDKTAPIVEGIVDGGQYSGDVSFTVHDAEGTPVRVTLDGVVIEPDAQGRYFIAADDRSHTVVVTSGTHELTYTVTVHVAETVDPGDEPTDPETPEEPALVLNKIVAMSADGGSLSLSQSLAAEGQTILVTVQPDAGYSLDSVTARDENNETIALTRTETDRYSFTMPALDVIVEAQFTKDSGDTEPDDPEKPVDPSDPDEPEKFPFIDVTPPDWFYQDVYDVWEKGLVAGVTSNLYMPQEDMTRAMTVTILSRFEDEIPTVPGAWYESARVWGMDNGICDGTRMEDDVTREELATMLWRYAKFRDLDVSAVGELSAFRDADEISGYADEAMVWAVGSGIVGGKGEGILDPGGNGTRAEFAAMVNRFANLYDL